MNIRKSLFFAFLALLFVVAVYFIFAFFSSTSEQTGVEDVEPGGLVGIFNTNIGRDLGLDQVSQNIRTITAPNRETSTNTREINIFDNNESERAGVSGSGQPKERLIKLFDGKTAGYRVEEIDDDGEVVVRIIEKGRGNRYVVNSNTRSQTLAQAGELTKVLESHLFENDKVLVIYESDFDETQTQSAIVPFIQTSALDIQQLENNIRATTDGENQLFFTQRTANGVIGLVVDTSNPANTKEVWRSNFSNWIPRWGRNNLITLGTPISRYAQSKTYLINPRNENTIFFYPIDVGGGVFVETASGYFLTYEVGRNSLIGKSFIRDKGKNVDIEIPATLPEKCDSLNTVFVCAIPNILPATTLSGHNTVFPDSWYQGDLSLEDSIVLINVREESVSILLGETQGDFETLTDGETLDIINLQITEDGKSILFVNKKDGNLWMLRV